MEARFATTTGVYTFKITPVSVRMEAHFATITGVHAFKIAPVCMGMEARFAAILGVPAPESHDGMRASVGQTAKNVRTDDYKCQDRRLQIDGHDVVVHVETVADGEVA